MKKYRMKNYLKIGILLFGISLLLVNCQKDNFNEFDLETSKKPPNLKATVTNGGNLLKTNNNLKTILNKFVKDKSRNNYSSRTIYSNEYGFSIDTTLIQQIETATYKSYTFIVERGSNNQAILENYVYTIYNDTTSVQYLVTYTLLDSFEFEYDIENATIQTIDDNSLIYSRGSCASIVEYEDPVCVDTPCIGTGKHIIGKGEWLECAYLNKPGGPSINCTGGGWVDQGCPDSNGGTTSSEDYNPNDTTTGGNGNTGDTDTTEEEEEDVVIVPLDDFGNKRECRKINNFLDNNPNFKTFLLSLNDQTNIDYEKSISKFENEPIIITDQGTPGEPEVRLLDNPSEDYEAFAHYHYETTTTLEGDTYSVFTIDDLVGIAELLNNDYLDHRKFVTFLSTGKGTHYALTINNKARFLEAFNYVLNPEPPNITNTELALEWLDKKAEWERLKKKFYEDDDASIKKTNTDNNIVLAAFLQFMDEANMGATMYKTDENFNDFTRVTYNANAINNIKEKPCNN
ncbi:hypothetical protein [Lacinutrix salivirga]